MSTVCELRALEISNEQAFKTHNDLPLARIKRIMKSDEDVRMISVSVPWPQSVFRNMPDAGRGASSLRQSL